MRSVRLLAALASASLALAACGGSRTATPPANPAAASAALPGDARILWLDATANFGRLGTADSVAFYLGRAAEAGFTDIVVDVKPLSGEVLYPSAVAPRLRTFGGYTRDDAFDFPAVAIREGRARGMRVHLAANIFAEGHQNFSTGPIYTTHPEWQTTLLAPDGSLKPTTEVKAGYSAFTNPADPEVQAYELSVVREVVTRYRPDGFVLDRARYDNVYSDFSPLSRRLFEAWRGAPVANWPSDVMSRSADPAKPTRGPLFNAWLEWRASVIHDFFSRARTTVKGANAATRFAVYVGAWYPAYYEVGVNWASPAYDPSTQYDWATPTYKNHGYAPLLDFLMTGNYYVEVTPEDLAATNDRARLDNVLSQVRDTVYNVEASIRDVARKVRGATTVFPSLYVEQYRDARKPENYERALRKTLDMAGGVMVFDLVHLERDPAAWDATRRALADYPRGRPTPY